VVDELSYSSSNQEGSFAKDMMQWHSWCLPGLSQPTPLTHQTQSTVYSEVSLANRSAALHPPPVPAATVSPSTKHQARR
jgi:hypothetical protein